MGFTPVLGQQEQVAESPAAMQAGETPPAPTQPNPDHVKPSEDPMRPRVLFETTMGNFVIELEGEKAPVTTRNFIRYVEEGFYEGTIFHRVIEHFVIQAGGFLPDMTVKTEGLHDPIPNEWKNGLKNLKWTVAAARVINEPDSATSQFFINLGNSMPLDLPRDGAAYCVFGKVIEGTDVVKSISQVQVHKHPEYPQSRPTTPVTPIVVTKASVIGDYDREKINALADEIQSQLQAEIDNRIEKMNAEIEEYVKKYEDESGKKVQKTDSGLRYAIIKEGDGPSPEMGDQAKLHYIGWLLDGTQFKNTYDQGEPELKRIRPPAPPGWIEGITMMKVGGKRRLILPYDIAFGGRGRGSVVPPYSSVVFEVELLGVTRAADLPPDNPITPVRTPRPAVKEPDNLLEKRVQPKEEEDE